MEGEKQSCFCQTLAEKVENIAMLLEKKMASDKCCMISYHNIYMMFFNCYHTCMISYNDVHMMFFNCHHTCMLFSVMKDDIMYIQIILTVYKNDLIFIWYHMTYRVPNRNCGVRGQPPQAPLRCKAHTQGRVSLLLRASAGARQASTHPASALGCAGWSASSQRAWQ
jgi:hypothetical protein